MDFAQLDLIGMVRNSGIVVQMVLALLLFFSVSSWAIIIIKWRYIRRALRESAEFSDYFWKSRDFSSAFAKAKSLPGSPLARIFRIAYLELKKTSQAGEPLEPTDGAAPAHPTFAFGARMAATDNVKRALRRAINTEMTRMIQMIPFLATTGNTTPFIGLFGTVWGIMNSFHGIGQKGSASLAVVAPGISEALVTTAAGLAAAIPAVIAYNFFMSRIRLVETEFQSFTADFLNIIERDILRVERRKA
jgi:biopolymer transport protein TolQ